MSINFPDVVQELKWLGYSVEQVENLLWRVQGVENDLPIGKTATSDQVIIFYNEINDLVHKLGYLAMNWRGEKSQDIVQKYQEIILVLWDLGWRGVDLLPDEELPDELMPDYFLSYWINKKQEYNKK